MIIHPKDMKTEEKANMRGGAGTVSLLHLVEPGTTKNVRLFSKITLPPGASIGYHRHDNEAEYFLFLEGTGTANDDGVEKAVSPGDVMVTPGGTSHSVTNTGASPLVFAAVIATY